MSAVALFSLTGLVLTSLADFFIFMEQRVGLDLSRDARIDTNLRWWFVPGWHLKLVWPIKLSGWGFVVALAIAGWWWLALGCVALFYVLAWSLPLPVQWFLARFERELGRPGPSEATGIRGELLELVRAARAADNRRTGGTGGDTIMRWYHAVIIAAGLALGGLLSGGVYVVHRPDAEASEFVRYNRYTGALDIFNAGKHGAGWVWIRMPNDVVDMAEKLRQQSPQP
jgi:hypothetical protein